ncbi:hypothetical protein [Geomonas agri]|uniref:hypothetical protein n=1 Tax=Geomonas agri TaxID=2873702 RepID=UPI001CD646F1|nr:hypothetical protein [Geomonas agri]
MLALDSTQGCIEVSESDVVDLYRSAPITRSSDQRTEAMEAYICAIRRKTLVKVYLALVVNDHKIYVYSSPGKGKREQEYPEEIEKSLSCASAMGFSPERVDLSYSPAMREVVVRNTKVLRLPGSKGAGLKHGLAGAPVLPMLLKSVTTADEPAVQNTPAPAPIVAATAVAAVQKDGGELLAALARMQHEHQTLTAERDALARQLQQLSTQQRETDNELSALRKASEDIAGAKDALRSQQQTDELLAAKDAVIAQLQKQVAELALEREALSTKNAELSRTHDAMLENLAQARHDIAALSAQRDAALADSGAALLQHRETVSQLDEARLEVEKVSGEAAGARQRAEALEESTRSKDQALDTLRRELAEASSARDAALQRLAAQSEQTGTDAELGLLRRELVQVGAERDTALARLAARDERQAREAEETQAHLRKELERAQGERDAALQRLADQEEHLDAEPAETPGRVPDGKHGQQEQPETLQEATPATPRDAADSNTGCRPGEEAFPSRILPGIQDVSAEPLPTFAEGALPPFSELQAAHEMEPAWDRTADVAEPGGEAPSEPAPAAEKSRAGFFGEQETSFVPLGDLQNGFFSASDDEPVRFLLETGLDAIDCPSADDVLELHQSINNAYLSPEGTGGQESCQGYICSLRKGEDKVVVAAIYGTTSHRTRVYLPEAQPRDEESYARTVRCAISFAEEVGLMMERVPLEATGPKRQERLKRCPALRLA